MRFIGVIGGIWGLVMIVLFIQALRYCYAAERRSYPEKFEGRLPRRANFIAVAFNFKSIARDAETQELRWKMNRLMLIILATSLAMAIFLMVAVPDVE